MDKKSIIAALSVVKEELLNTPDKFNAKRAEQALRVINKGLNIMVANEKVRLHEVGPENVEDPQLREIMNELVRGMNRSKEIIEQLDEGKISVAEVKKLQSEEEKKLREIRRRLKEYKNARPEIAIPGGRVGVLVPIGKERSAGTYEINRAKSGRRAKKGSPLPFPQGSVRAKGRKRNEDYGDQIGIEKNGN